MSDPKKVKTKLHKGWTFVDKLGSYKCERCHQVFYMREPDEPKFCAGCGRESYEVER